METHKEADGEQDWHAFTARRLVAQEFRVAESALMQSSRATADVAFARQVAMYLAHVVYSLSYADVATAFGRERSTVSHACALVEDQRDDPAFDQRLQRIEDRLIQLDRIRSKGRIIRPRISPVVSGGQLRLAGAALS